MSDVVIDEFQGEQSELDFLKFIAKRSQKLCVLLLVLTEEKFTSEEELIELNCQLGALSTFPWAARDCNFLVLLGFEAEIAWTFHKASDLSVENPFF